MPAKISFTSASALDLVLAKIGHPQRDEPLQTSKEVFKIDEKDRESLATIFLKPFRNLTPHHFSHHTSLSQHEMNNHVAAIFASEDALLEHGCSIAKRLYAKSNHPNIKSGDLCISAVKDIEIDGKITKGLCILKSESVVPFLSISTRNGDLEMHTEQGINPEKIDKGCLILNHLESKGYYVLTFDRSGSDSRFWVRDFLGVIPIADSPFLTNKFANLAAEFIEKEKKENTAEKQDSPPWDASNAAITYFEEKEKFDLDEFEDEVLKTPEAKAKFSKHRSQVEEEQGHKLEDSFKISKKDVTKAKKKIRSAMKLDTGVEIRLKPALAAKPEKVLEHGFDDERQMKFIKIYFNEDLAK